MFINRFHGFVNTISVDELSQISPGEMLLYLMVEQLASEKIQSLDLGAGDETYKRSWCQHQITLFDTIHPVTAPAVPVALLALKGYIHAKRYMSRNNQTLWRIIKKSSPDAKAKAHGAARELIPFHSSAIADGSGGGQRLLFGVDAVRHDVNDFLIAGLVKFGFKRLAVALTRTNRADHHNA